MSFQQEVSPPMPPHNLIEPPAPAELRQLYEVEQVRHAVVAAKCGVSKTTAKRWAREAGIAYPHTRGKAHTPEAATPGTTPLDPTAPKRPRGRPRKGERAWLRLTETERKAVQRNVDDFLAWVAIRNEESE